MQEIYKENKGEFSPEDRETFKKWVSLYLSFRRLNYVNRGKIGDESEMEQLVRESSYHGFLKPVQRFGIHFDKNQELIFDIDEKFPAFMKTLEPSDITIEVRDFLLTREDWSFPHMIEGQAAHNYVQKPDYRKKMSQQFRALAVAYMDMSKKMKDQTLDVLSTNEGKKFFDNAEAMKAKWYLFHNALSNRGLRYPIEEVKNHRLFATAYRDSEGVFNWENFSSDWDDTIKILKTGYDHHPEISSGVIGSAALSAKKILSESRVWMTKNVLLSDSSPQIFPKLKKIEEGLEELLIATNAHFG